jgi:STE24 endopeptidase
MSASSIFYLINGIIVLSFLLDRYLEYINHQYTSPELPTELSAFYDAEKYKKSILYHKEKDRLSLWAELISFAGIIAFLWLNGFAWLNNILEPYFSDSIPGKIVLALVYFAILSLATGIISLPLGIYNTFVIEQKYGFNTTTAKTYITDKIKGALLGIIIGGSLGYLFLGLILKIGPDFWLLAWGLAIIITLILNMFYTSIIVPIFNKLSPLPEGELRNSIETYAQSVKFPLTNIMVINGSKRSTKANAFFSGIGKSKKIVLYDTLIEKHTNDELVSILAHELGHYKKKHIVLSMILSWLQMGFMLWLLSQFIFSEKLSQALGVPHLSIQINLIAFGILFEPISIATGILMNILSRKNEYEADAYAVETANPQSFVSALIRLSTDNLSNLKPHPAYVFFHFSHPTLLQRINAINGNPQNTSSQP